MANPTLLAMAALKRLGRYSEGRLRQDWAGCVKTRKSTSGGCPMLGSHLLKSWSNTQGLVFLGSGESKFSSVTTAAGIGLGFQSLLHDLGIHMEITFWTDSSATL